MEVPLEIIQSSNRKIHRADAVVYDRTMQPIMLIECKAETIALTQKTLDQALVYNRKLNVPYLMLHNGPQTIVAQVSETGITLLPSIPTFPND